MKLFDALGSAEKTLHANPGSHFRVPSFEIDSSIRLVTIPACKSARMYQRRCSGL